MAKVSVQTYNPEGSSRRPLKNMQGEVILVEREITDDLPADVIGEAVVEAVREAWKSGHDPVLGQHVVVRFE